MTPAALITALSDTGLTHAQIAAAAGVHVTTLHRWKSGRSDMPLAARVVLEMVLGKRTGK